MFFIYFIYFIYFKYSWIIILCCSSTSNTFKCRCKYSFSSEEKKSIFFLFLSGKPTLEKHICVNQNVRAQAEGRGNYFDRNILLYHGSLCLPCLLRLFVLFFSNWNMWQWYEESRNMYLILLSSRKVTVL